MNDQNSQPTRLSPRSQRLLRILNGMVLIAFIISLSIAYGVSSDFINSHEFISAFTDVMGAIVPSVKNVAIGAPHPDVARLVLASQWLFFPFYFIFLILAQPPWGSIPRERIMQIIALRRKQQKSREYFVAMSFGVCTMLLFFLSDIGVIDFFPSFYKGTIFSSDVVRHSAILASQRTFTFGVVLVAWFSPIAEAFLCLAFLLGFAVKPVLEIP